MPESTFELQNLGNKPPIPPRHPLSTGANSELDVVQHESVDNVMSVWAWASAIASALFATLLTLAPRLLLFAGASSTDVERRNVLTSLESFLALHFGIFLYATSASLLLSIPAASPIQQQQFGTPWHPQLGSFSAAACISAFAAYNTDDVGPLSFLVFVGNTLIGGFGLWAMAFSGSTRISRKTGADKRTSRFLFGNRAAASVQKKQWKEEQKKTR